MDQIAIYPPNKKKANEWIIALAADSVPFLVDQNEQGWILYVPTEQSLRAEETIRGYEQDNIDWPPKPILQPRPNQPVHDTWAAFHMALFIAVFFIWLGPYDGKHDLMRAGASDSEAIRAGEFWRSMTALTMHSGFTHMAGNILFLVIMGQVICRKYGAGIGSALIWLTGILGNLTVAFASPSPHLAVGASTACFGALGFLAADQAVERLRLTGTWRSIYSRIWIPLFAGVAMLGFTGGSAGSDLAAHGFGFVYGLLLAAPANLTKINQTPEWLQRVLELGGLALCIFAWKAAAATLATAG